MAKKNTDPKPIEQPALVKALVDAGYELAGISKHGKRTAIRLKPADLLGADDNFKALEVCCALGVQADCSIHAAVPPLLIVTVELDDSQSEIGNQQSEILEPQPELPAPQSEVGNQQSELQEPAE